MSRELILEWAIFILIGHPLPSCLLSKGLVLILTAFSSCLKLRAHPGHPAPYEPFLPVPLISLLPANLQTLIQEAVVLVKVLLRQVRVVFQTRCRFVWELDWSLSPAVCWGRRGEWCALLCPAAPAPQPRHSARSAQTWSLIVCHQTPATRRSS